jgi:hypothetical protein
MIKINIKNQTQQIFEDEGIMWPMMCDWVDGTNICGQGM